MELSSQALPVTARSRLVSIVRLGKPRVVSMIVFTAVIGMLLATPGLPPAALVAYAALGIGLAAMSAAALNCLLEQRIDRVMARTRARPLVRDEVTRGEAIAFIAVTGVAGLAILAAGVNALTMALTVATFMGYAIVYTVLLKPLTPQNIVIGGASGAMPPILGCAAATGAVSPESLLLFLIIFAWTPPHFWALALYRRKEYAQARVPMLPVTHGAAFTRRFIFLYTLVLVAASVLPFAAGPGGPIYLASALALGARFLMHAWHVNRDPGDAAAMRMFRFSITYLALLFAALLIDHYSQGAIA
jgi:protoheme IX farnesyltransferase